jgi:hypothetical protein
MRISFCVALKPVLFSSDVLDDDQDQSGDRAQQVGKANPYQWIRPAWPPACAMNFTPENARSFALDLYIWAQAMGGDALETARNIYNNSGFSPVMSFDEALVLGTNNPQHVCKVSLASDH